jgi:hypothetical protein
MENKTSKGKWVTLKSGENPLIILDMEAFENKRPQIE